tara:strand:+ start:256 stop:477 length:222 start_codon:yes stop_codon:yes gene_type:complete
MINIEKQKNKEMNDDIMSNVSSILKGFKLTVNNESELNAEVYVAHRGLEGEERERVKAEYKDLFESQINVITP